MNTKKLITGALFAGVICMGAAGPGAAVAMANPAPLPPVLPPLPPCVDIAHGDCSSATATCIQTIECVNVSVDGPEGTDPE
jgi:hypothetical protein